MKYFIFRNQTIEPFLGEKDTAYSGYDDISIIPREAERYIWFYQVPFKMNSQQLAEEVSSYIDKLHHVISLIGEREIWVFTLINLFRFRLFGNDTQVDEAVSRFNLDVQLLVQTNKNIKLLDFEDFTSDYTEKQLVNWKYYFISQTQLNIHLAKDFHVWFARQEEKMAGKRKKCLILDLDNTLWGGTLGEDGTTGIQIGGDYPGNSFLDWQQALLELQKTGVLLTICSKNDEQTVMEAWKDNPFMVLRMEHFSTWRINWKDKATNIVDIARELNIGLDSMVFLDDNPVERAWVHQILPLVSVPEFPSKPFDLLTFFRDMVKAYFYTSIITDEDRKKTEQYSIYSQREAECHHYADLDSFLQSLNITLSVMPADRFNICRIAQMTQKINQFNLTTHRLTEQDIWQQISNGWRIYCISVKDRFGDNGITGCIFITPQNHIDNMMLSCRILGKGIETAFVSHILNLLSNEGITTVTARYVPSPNNSQTSDFYHRLGFTQISEDEEGKYYQLSLTKELPIKSYYHIRTE